MAISRTHTHCRRSLTPYPDCDTGANGSGHRLRVQYPSDLYVCAGGSSLRLFHQMMVECVSDEFSGGRELQLV